jgi:hypothetical protein
MPGPFTGAEAQESGGGTFTFAGAAVLNITDFTCNEEITLHETTPAGSISRTFNHGLKTSSGGFSCFHDLGSPSLDVGTRGSIVATLYSGRTITISAIIEKTDVTWKVDGTCDVNYTWRQTSAIGTAGVAGDYVKV